MKIRIGIGLGTTTTAAGDPATFGSLVDDLERLGFDSLWLSERMTAPAPHPLVALGFAAARTTRLKLGTSVQVLPGRLLADVAKEWATLDHLSAGRALPAFGLGVADPREQAAFGVERRDRAARFDEMLPALRRLWAGEGVDGVAVQPPTLQQPIDVWLGGLAPSELRRVGRLGDGWLPSFCTPDDVAAGRATITEVASEHGRDIDAEHWGALVILSAGPLPDRFRQAIAARRPGVDPDELIPTSPAALRARLEEFVAVGASKFVVVPAIDADDWTRSLEDLADAVLDLQR